MILITGANGQLGTELRHLLDEHKIEYIGTDVAEMDITDARSVKAMFEKVEPDVVFHCGAYTAVDKAEDEGKELNYRINVEGTQNVAKACEAIGATLIYISTDYVFDGTSPPYQVDDQPSPLNFYGESKLAGEQAIRQAYPQAIILRVPIL